MEIALGFGLVFALVSMTTAMAQVERRHQRIYRDPARPKAPAKYGRAAVLTGLLALPVGLGFLLLVTGGAFARAMAADYGWSDRAVLVWNLARWPAGLALLVLAIAVVLDHVPRRRQPSLSWLALGSGVAVTLSMTATGLLAAYVHTADSFGSIHGPLGGVFALLLWALLTSMARSSTARRCARSSRRAGLGTRSRAVRGPRPAAPPRGRGRLTRGAAEIRMPRR